MTTKSRALTVGDTVHFKGYAEALPADQQMLVVGEQVIVTGFTPDGGAMVKPVDDRNGGDTAFAEELTLPEHLHFGEVAAAVVPAAAAAKPPKPPTKKQLAAEAAAAKAAEVGPQTAAEKKAAAKAVTDAAKAEAKAAQEKVKAEAKVAAAEAKAAAAAAKAAANPAKITATAAPTAAEVSIVDSQAVLDILEAQDALVAAKSLAMAVEQSYFNLGGVLNRIHEKELYKQAGYSGKRAFSDYVEKELGYGYRKAMELISIYRNIRVLEVSEERLAEIGWSKAKLIAKHADAENFDSLVEMAKNNSREQLDVLIKNTFVGAGDGQAETRIAKTKMTFTLHADQATTVSRALEAAKNLANTEDLNAALEYALGEWLQTAEGVEVTQEDAIAFLQSKYGIRLAVVAEDGTVLHQIAAE